MAKRSLKDVLIYAGPALTAGKGDLRKLKIDANSNLVSDEEKAEQEQKDLYEARKKRAVKLMGEK